MRSIFAAAIITSAALALPSEALAQFAANSGEDIELYSDVTVSGNGVTTLTGQVDIRQGQVRMLADTVKIYSKSSSGSVAAAASDIDRIVATGNFYYITPDQEVRGDQGVYQAASDTFTVTGDVILLQDENIVTGTKLIYEVGQQMARVTADCMGRKCGTNRRVSILLKNTGNNSQAGRS